MYVEAVKSGAFGWALVNLDPGERFVAEAGSMFRASSNIDIDVTTRSRDTGGIMSGIKRMIAGENFFFSTFTAAGDGPAEVGLAPTLQGEVAVIDCSGRGAWVCAGGSYLGSSPHLNVDTQFQGLRGVLSGESLSFLLVDGVGPLVVNAFGKITEVEVAGELTVDNGHVVAFEDSLTYSIGKAGGSWVQSFLTGEGVTMNFSGRGRLYVQSHNPDEFGKSLGPLLPPRRS
jgi:uncharacterized protein (TIGR00266 family)